MRDRYPLAFADQICFQCKQVRLVYRYCFQCIADYGIVPIAPNDIDNRVFAPWTDEQQRSLKAYQKSDQYAPLVCPSDHVYEVASTGLICFKCRKEHLLNSAPMQTWAYDWTLNWVWSHAQNDEH